MVRRSLDLRPCQARARSEPWRLLWCTIFLAQQKSFVGQAGPDRFVPPFMRSSATKHWFSVSEGPGDVGAMCVDFGLIAFHTVPHTKMQRHFFRSNHDLSKSL